MKYLSLPIFKKLPLSRLCVRWFWQAGCSPGRHMWCIVCCLAGRSGFQVGQPSLRVLGRATQCTCSMPCCFVCCLSQVWAWVLCMCALQHSPSSALFLDGAALCASTAALEFHTFSGWGSPMCTYSSAPLYALSLHAGTMAFCCLHTLARQGTLRACAAIECTQQLPAISAGSISGWRDPLYIHYGALLFLLALGGVAGMCYSSHACWPKNLNGAHAHYLCAGEM